MSKEDQLSKWNSLIERMETERRASITAQKPEQMHEAAKLLIHAGEIQVTLITGIFSLLHRVLLDYPVEEKTTRLEILLHMKGIVENFYRREVDHNG